MKASTNAPAISATSTDWGIASLRMAMGLTFLVHGWEKILLGGVSGFAGFLGTLGVPFPTMAAAGVAGFEVVGGLALIAGLFSRYLAIPLAFIMLTALGLFHLPTGSFTGDLDYQLALVLLTGLVTLILHGSGALSLDTLIHKLRATAGLPRRAVEAALVAE
jgi:putative oxidoreductase